MVESTIVEDKGISAFPKLMISHTGCVILATAADQSTKCITGTVVKSSYHKYGVYLTTWDMKQFKDFYGSITLQNTF